MVESLGMVSYSYSIVTMAVTPR